MVKAYVTSPRQRKSGKKDVGKSGAVSNSTCRQRSRPDTSQSPSAKPRDVLREDLAANKAVTSSTARRRTRAEDDSDYLPSSANERGKGRGPASHRKDYDEQEKDEEVSDRGSDDEGESKEDVDEEVHEEDDESKEDVDEEVHEEDDEEEMEGEIEVDMATAASGEPSAKKAPKRSLAAPSKLPTVAGLTAEELDFLMVDLENGEHSFLATCGEFLVVDVVEGCI